ncbi:uncharacterized protein LOC132464884 [Gadus macrocephalus]|uniref:uncharacterized protein LOC132464884 n=1 Tax=Gadus macrocephalus TaxID=80720 RepID=UPI0028CB6508|nr:uncharacterized protein LOC132464884 [Gadus macrocephalus]
MEKSQWDLKKVRLQSRRFKRMDDFVAMHKVSTNALLREYADSLKKRRKQKRHQVETEKWKHRSQRKRAVYAAPRKKAFTFQTTKNAEPLSTADCPSESRPSSPLCPVNVLHLSSPEHASVQLNADSPGESHPSSSDLHDQQLTLLWRKRSTEVVVAVLPSKIKGRSIYVHHSELRSLRPHLWLTGEIIHGLMHLSAYTHNVVDTIYLMDHYTAGVILSGDRATVRRQSLPKVNFENYEAMLSFIHVNGNHWNMLYIHAKSGTVFQLDPSPASSELEDSVHAATKIQEYFKMRRTSHGKTDWVDVQWKCPTQCKRMVAVVALLLSK